MKHLKTFKIFESSFNKEEFCDYINRELANYNIRPIEIRNLLSKYESEIEMRVESGENPSILTKEIINDLDLTTDRKYPAIKFNLLPNPEIKYL